MQLFAEQLGEILGALAALRVPKGHAEKRSFFRIGARYRIAFRLQGPSTDAWLRDVSATGVGMLVSGEYSPLPLGTTL